MYRSFFISFFGHLALIAALVVLSLFTPPLPKNVIKINFVDMGFGNTPGQVNIPGTNDDPNAAPGIDPTMATPAPTPVAPPPVAPAPKVTPKPMATPAPEKTVAAPKPTPAPVPEKKAEPAKKETTEAAKKPVEEPKKTIAAPKKADTSKEKKIIKSDNKEIVEAHPTPKPTPEATPEAGDENGADKGTDEKQVASATDAPKGKTDSDGTEDGKGKDQAAAAPAVPDLPAGPPSPPPAVDPNAVLGGDLGQAKSGVPAVPGQPIIAGGQGGKVGNGPLSIGAGNNQNINLNQTYFLIVLAKIKEKFQPPAQRAGIECLVKFTIQKNGTIINPQIVKSTGNSAWDQYAIQAIGQATIPPLYDSFKESSLDVVVTFSYDKRAM